MTIARLTTRLIVLFVLMTISVVVSAQQLTTRFMSLDDGDMVEAEAVFTLDIRKRTITVKNVPTSRVRVLHIVNTHDTISRDDMEVQTFECAEGINRVDFSQVRSTKPGKPIMFSLTYKLGDTKVFQETYLTDW